MWDCWRGSVWGVCGEENFMRKIEMYEGCEGIMYVKVVYKGDKIPKSGMILVSGIYEYVKNENGGNDLLEIFCCKWLSNGEERFVYNADKGYKWNMYDFWWHKKELNKNIRNLWEVSYYHIEKREIEGIVGSEEWGNYIIANII